MGEKAGTASNSKGVEGREERRQEEGGRSIQQQRRRRETRRETMGDKLARRRTQYPTAKA